MLSCGAYASVAGEITQVTLNDLQVVRATLGDAPPAGATGTPVTLELRNVGSKALSAYEIALDVTYADGTHVTTAITEDIVYTIALSSVKGALPTPNATLKPGETHTVSSLLKLAPSGARATAVSAKVVTVLSLNRTTAGNEKTIKLILTARREQAERLSAMLAKLETVKSSSDQDAAFANAIAEYDAHIDRNDPGQNAKRRLQAYRDVKDTPESFTFMLHIDKVTAMILKNQSVRYVGGAQ